MVNGRYWLHTLGCPKNQVDSDKLEGRLAAGGYHPADGPGDADLVVVNTCAFIEEARQESIDTVLELADARREGARLVVTGCMAERYGDELADALPEVDLVAGFGSPFEDPGIEAADNGAAGHGRRGVPVQLGETRARPRPAGSAFDLLELPRPAARAPWAYVKVAEGCDRTCGFCAIPSFRGRQRSREMGTVLDEVRALVDGAGGAGGTTGVPVREVVLVAQDLASFGRDRSRREQNRSGRGTQPIVTLTRAVTQLVERTRLLYLYPSGLTDELVTAVLDTGVPYFDLSLQHVSRPHLARMRRWGDGERFLRRIAEIRQAEPEATFRSSFILGYPGETEADQDALLEFLRRAQLDWAGFFPFSPEEGTHAACREDQVPRGLALERLRECAELQDSITADRRDGFVGSIRRVLVDAPGLGRTVHEAPEIDGVVQVPRTLAVGSVVDLVVTRSLGTDLVAETVDGPAARRPIEAAVR
jgi:ribosomal protein S12 methylthiotransferase